MSIDITLTDLANLQNETTACAAINANNEAIETAFADALSRSGTLPNQMNSNLDMNSNHIINLPVATSATDPVRLSEFQNAVIGGLGLGTTGIVVSASIEPGSVVTRSIQGTTEEITVTDGSGISGNPRISLPSVLTLTDKTVNGGTFNGISLTGNTSLTVNDATFVIQDDADITKKMRFETSGITTGNTRTYTVPDAATTLVGTDVPQTLTNKSLTSPSITTPVGIVKGDVGLGNVANVDTTNASNVSSGTLPAARLPAFAGGDVTSSVGTVISTIGSNVVTNAKLSQAAAYTLKGNATGSTANVTDIDITALTSKASPISADIVLIQDSAASNAFKKTTVGALSSAGSVSSVNGQTGALVAFLPPQGRLTLQSGSPVMSTSQSAKTTLYYSAYLGSQVPIYDGTNIVPTIITAGEISVLTTDATKSPAAIGASKVNDWFVWNDAGTIRLGHGPDWTNDTTRSAGTALSRVNGLLVNTSSITNGPAANRGTYVGTTRSNAASQLDYVFGSAAAGGGAAYFWVWNAYNRRTTSTGVNDSNSSWSYATINTWAPFDVAGTGSGLNNRVSYVAGLAEDGVEAIFRSLMTNPGSGSASIGIGVDSTSVMSGAGGFGVSTGGINAVGVGSYCGMAGLGAHYLQALQFTQAASASFYGNLGTGQDMSSLNVTIIN